MKVPALLVIVMVACAALAKANLPPEKELKTLAFDSLLAFNRSVQAKDFTSFHGGISKLWQGQITPAQMRDIFKDFIEREIDMSYLQGSVPVFDKPPAIDDDGVLVLEGHCPTVPTQVDFRLKYVNEKNAWKLFGIRVNLASAKAPPVDEVRALVLKSLGAFNRALKQENFDAFYKGQIAQPWQKETTPEKLQSLFQSFIDQEIDLAPVLKLEPVFDPEPSINENGLLEAKGTFPTRPSVVNFHLAYFFEDSAWKLMKIHVKVEKGDDEDSSD